MLIHTTTATRIRQVLEMAPLHLSGIILTDLCGGGMVFAAGCVRKALGKLERAGLITRYRISRSRNGWVACKWGRAPEKVIEMGEALRENLPARRRCITQTVRIYPTTGCKQTIHYSIGLYPDGRPAELFIDVSKAGAALRGWCGESGMMMSIALQHGTPLHTILDLFIGTRNDPSGRVEGHPRITTCSSIMDLIARDMAITFLRREDLADKAEWESVPVPISDRAELPPPIEGQTCVCHQERANQVS